MDLAGPVLIPAALVVGLLVLAVIAFAYAKVRFKIATPDEARAVMVEGLKGHAGSPRGMTGGRRSVPAHASDDESWRNSSVHQGGDGMQRADVTARDAGETHLPDGDGPLRRVSHGETGTTEEGPIPSVRPSGESLGNTDQSGDAERIGAPTARARSR